MRAWILLPIIGVILACGDPTKDDDDDEWSEDGDWDGSEDIDGGGGVEPAEPVDEDSGDGEGDPETANPYDGPPVSFNEALTEVLVPTCGFDSCHGSGAGYLRIHESQTEQEWLDLYSTFLPTRKMVVPGDSSNSYLIQKMENSTGIEGEGMPPPDGGMSEYRIGMVRSWIDTIE